MKINKLIIIILLSSVIPAWSADQKDDKKKIDKTQVATSVINEGVVYFLPRTGISVKVKANKKKFIPGPYSEYADRYLGFKDVNRNAFEKCEILGIEVNPVGEADPNSVYKTTGETASMVSLMPDGVITGLNIENNIGCKIIEGNDLINYSEIPSIIFPDRSSNDYYDTEVNTATGDERTIFKTNEEKAREAADFLFKLREKRAYISNGRSDELPKDGLSYASYISQSEKTESEYLSLFLGKTFTSEQEYTFYFFPGEENVKNEVLFRFSDERGVLPKSDISGKPIMLEMIKDQKTLSSIEKLDSIIGDESKSGLYYRIPVYSSLILSDGITQYYSGRILVGQFGAIAAIHEMFTDGSYQIIFDRITGTLRNCIKIK